MSEDRIPFTEEDLHDLYLWVDSIPISRPKKNIARDFSDGCSVAEILHHFFPKMVEMHNYVPSMARARKMANWETLNTRVLGKLYFTVPRDEMEDLVAAVPGAIERFLRALRIKISQIKAHQEAILQQSSFSVQPKREHSDPSPKSSLTIVKSKQAPSGRAAPSWRSAHSSRGHADVVGLPRTAAVEGNSRADRLDVRSVQSQSHGSRLVRNEYDPDDGDDGSNAETHAKKSQGGNQHQRKKSSNASLSYGEQLLDEKGRTIIELKETVSILSEKVMKLEELLHIKDQKLSQYRQKYGRL